MDSPDIDGKAAASSPPIKDSPFYAYASSLSPIHLIQTGPGFLSYGDMNFPSPEPVFRSPHIRQRKLDVLRSSEKHCTNNPRNDTTCSRDGQMDGMPASSSTFQTTLSIQNTCDGTQSAEKQPCCGSSCDDMFLADLLESSLNESGYPDISSMQTEDTSQVMNGRSSRITANQTKYDRHKFANSQDIAPPASSLMNEFIAGCLRTSDFPDVQLKQGTIPPQVLLDDCAYAEGNVLKIHCSEMHNICDGATDRLISSSKAENDQFEESSFAENVENRLKPSYQVEESNKISQDQQMEAVPSGTNISRALPVGTQNENNLMDQKTDIPSFQSMDLADGMWKPSSSYLHYHEGMNTDISGNPEFDEFGLNSELIQGSTLDDHAVGNTIILAENQISYDEEASQHQYAMRKRLQCETGENHKRSPASEKQVTKFRSNISGAGSAEKLMDTSTLGNSIVEPTEAFSSNQLVQSAITAGVSCQKIGGSHVKVQAIGLHLNTLEHIGQATPTAMQLIEKDTCEEETPLSGVIDQVVQPSKDQLPSTTLTSHDSISVSASKGKEFLNSAGDDNDVMSDGGNLNGLSISSSSCQALLDAGNFQCSLPADLADRYLTPCNMKRLHAESTISAMSTQPSPRKKRKKGTNIEGQKRCSCKRSKCLKLYCDCFAAGAVCTEACGCHECLNKHEHQDTIFEMRKQIESRNPLAFAPKIILHASNPPDDDDGSMRSTPSSARHKRGCNCKKSLCLKKYCECFQVGVGCSIGCRCEGCKNIFGRNDGSSGCIEIKHQNPKEDDYAKESSVKNLDATVKGDVSRLSPLTPSIQHSNGSGADIPKPLLNLSYLTSPESSASLVPCHGLSSNSPIRSIGDITFDNDTEDANSLVPDDHASLNYDTAEKVAGMLSPEWDSFQELLSLSPLASLSRCTTDTSVASKATNTSHTIVSSLHRHCSPVTPIPRLGESKVLPELDTSSRVHENPGKVAPAVMNMIPSSVGTVKSNYPKQKRTSPSKQTPKTKSISSPGLRGTRKFMLKSVPLFPPLTPCSNNKDDAT